MDRKDMRDVRARVASGLAGQVVEVGFGTGLDASFYPAEVTKVAAVEPSTLCMRIVQARIAQASARVELAGLTGEALDRPSPAAQSVAGGVATSHLPALSARCLERAKALGNAANQQGDVGTQHVNRLHGDCAPPRGRATIPSL
jgi:hypothetical protein